MSAAVVPFRRPELKPAIDYKTLPAKRGYVIHYATGLACPGCGRRAWHIGRFSAECGSCGCTVPLGAAQ